MTARTYTVLWPVNFNGTVYPQGGSLVADDQDPNILELLSSTTPAIELASSPTAAADLLADQADVASQIAGPATVADQEAPTP